MTKLAIIGGGKAAVIHAESSRAIPGVQLIGIGGRSPGRASAVATALGCDELTVDGMIRRADMLVVAVPPSETEGVLAQIPPDRPIIVESPVGASSVAVNRDRPNAMLGANLLHTQIVRQGLASISELDDAHHLLLRATGVRPSWLRGPAEGHGVVLDLGGRLLPVLLAAAGRPVMEVSAKLDLHGSDGAGAELDLRLDDGRLVRAELCHTDEATTADIEAASATGVVSLGLWPFPVLEVDGTEISSARSDPTLHALGFVSQLQRLTAVAKGEASPWPPLDSGVGTLRIIEAAVLSDSSGRPCHL